MAEGEVERVQEKNVNVKRQVNSRLITEMMNTFIRGSDEGDVDADGNPVPRVARLVENLWNLALHAENEGVRHAASNTFIDRIDGKAIERHAIEVRRVEGIVEMPAPIKLEEKDIICEFALAPAPDKE